MFEQSLYEIETPAPEPQEGDFLSGYEIKSWSLSPRIYKILGLSALANVMVLVIFAQTSVLTMKGCDSPLVGSVCQALDTIYVGSMLFSSKRDYIDAEYTKTDLANADITYIDVTANDANKKLEYPEGYFALANPEEYAMLQQQQDFPTIGIDPNFYARGIPRSTFPSMPSPTMRPSTGNSIFNTKPKLPKPPKKDVDDNDLPSISDSGTADSGATKRGKRPPLGNQPGNSGDPNASAQNGNKNPTTPSPTPEIAEPAINKRPFVDLGNKVNDLLDKNQVRLDSAFIVNASGKLTKDGKLDPKSFKWGQVASQDEKMIEVVKDSIQAINDSGYLSYLTGISGKDFGLMLQQDDTNITAIVQSDMESETRARSLKSSLDLAMSIAKMKKTGANADQNDKDDLILLENAKIETIGKKVVIRFLVPKNIALPMIQRKLADQKAAPRSPASNTVGRNDNRTAIR